MASALDLCWLSVNRLLRLLATLATQALCTQIAVKIHLGWSICKFAKYFLSN